MLGDDLAHRIRVDETNVENKRDEVVIQDHRLKVEVSRHQCPGRKVGQKTI